MIKNKESLVKQFRNDDPSTYLTNVDQRRKIDMVKTEEIKEPKKRVVEPVEIPEIISVPRYTSTVQKHYTELPESYNTRPVTVGLSRGFTQEKIREGQILQELDREMVIESNNDQTTNEEDKND